MLTSLVPNPTRSVIPANAGTHCSAGSANPISPVYRWRQLGERNVCGTLGALGPGVRRDDAGGGGTRGDRSLASLNEETI